MTEKIERKILMNTVLNIYAKVHSEAGCEYDWNKSILIFKGKQHA